MCYFLYLASPLTLSEIRSMLPAGLTADPASFSDQQAMKAIHPQTQTVARILSGRCSCDLVRARLPETREDERHLRERYRKLGADRSAVIQALERHRRAEAPPAQKLPGLLVEFVAEHARNAGRTIYLLRFDIDDSAVWQNRGGQPIARTPGEIRMHPDGWLVEGTPVVVG